MIDVTSLRNRRAINRWDRVSVGDLFERITWSYPDKEAIVGRPGAFADPALRRVTYRAGRRSSPTGSPTRCWRRGLERGDRVLMFCDNSTEAYVTKIARRQGGAWSARRSTRCWRRT